jgi:alpha-beta hydrolase superfamily lysophospholipase
MGGTDLLPTWRSIEWFSSVFDSVTPFTDVALAFSDQRIDTDQSHVRRRVVNASLEHQGAAMLVRLLKFVGIGTVVYFTIALALIAWPMPEPRPDASVATRQLGGLVQGGALAEPAPPQTFRARDGAGRIYRLYAGTGPSMLVLLHGSASDGRYLAKLSRSIAAATGFTVVTLDMRGHGSEPVRRGDVDDVSQQERDIADLVTTLRSTRTFDRFVLGGHSIGGGLAIRYAAGTQEPRPSALFLLAPYVHRSSPAARPDSGGWATPSVARFAGIEMLQRVGVRAFDGRPVLRFAVAKSAQDGTETPVYSWRLFASVTPRADWPAEISRIPCPILILGAEKDVIFRSEGYHEVFKFAKQATTQIVAGIDHFQLATSDQVVEHFAAWIAKQR